MKELCFFTLIFSVALTALQPLTPLQACDFLGYTYSIELMADIFPPLIFLASVIFIGLTTILYLLMRL